MQGLRPGVVPKSDALHLAAGEHAFTNHPTIVHRARRRRPFPVQLRISRREYPFLAGVTRRPGPSSRAGMLGAYSGSNDTLEEQ